MITPDNAAPRHGMSAQKVRRLCRLDPADGGVRARRSPPHSLHGHWALCRAAIEEYQAGGDAPIAST